MKPRLDPAPLTEEDRIIWRRICIFGFHAGRNEVCAEHAAQISDRRDADLMWRAQQQREWLATEHHGLLPPWLMPFEWECGPVGGDITRYIKAK